MGIRREIKTGDIVTSVSGRDKERYFVVMTANDKIVEICDGDLHKLDKQKKKNIKHVRYAGDCDDSLKMKIVTGEKISDSEVRKVIASFKEN